MRVTFCPMKTNERDPPPFSRSERARRFDRPGRAVVRPPVVDRRPAKLVIRRGRDRRKIKVRRERVRETRTHIYILMRLYNRLIRVSRALPPGAQPPRRPGARAHAPLSRPARVSE